jgi:Ran GTPase-activating protein (RanGAP) involved in mRNA processing and transport
VLDIANNEITWIGLDDITRLLQSTNLKKIYLSENHSIFGNEASTRRFARILSRHGFLKELDLHGCVLKDEGIHVIVDGLVGNTIMEVFQY